MIGRAALLPGRFSCTPKRFEQARDEAYDRAFAAEAGKGERAMMRPAIFLFSVAIFFLHFHSGAGAEGLDPKMSRSIADCLTASANSGDNLDACLGRVLESCGSGADKANACRYDISFELLKQVKGSLATDSSRQVEMVDQLDALSGEVCGFIIGDNYDVLMKDYFKSTCLFEKRKDIAEFMMPVAF